MAWRWARGHTIRRFWLSVARAMLLLWGGVVSCEDSDLERLQAIGINEDFAI